MKSEVSSILAIGGNVVERKENAKYGGAYISLVMSEMGWSSELMEKYATRLTLNRWKERVKLRSYCLDGVKLAISRHTGMHDNVGTNHISLTYNAQTVRDCKD